MKIDSRAKFEEVVATARSKREERKLNVLVCCGPGCLANGSDKVAKAFSEEIEKRGLNASVGLYAKETGCQGLCERGPLVTIEPNGTLYTKVKPGHVGDILNSLETGGEPVNRLLYRNPETKERLEKPEDIPFYKNQLRVVMGRIGRIDPLDIEDSLAHGAYSGLAKALLDMSPEEVVRQIEVSGLRGRGGGGFPTARKWKAASTSPGERKFVLCNGDEGDPGAFKDRAYMEGDPHSVIEGMVIGAYAVGAHEGYIYVRDEYPLAVAHLSVALEQARTYGFVGENILGSGFDFDIKISRGGGAFVCGESSALMRSLEGKTGEPRQKYVHATEKGLFGCPTVLNNVETWADVGAILDRGGDWFASIGTKKSKGTKAFSLVGKVKNTGLIELPMGTPLRKIIYDIGGGILKDRPFKAVQTGGPSGGCVPASLLDLPVDYEELTRAGSMMGSGGMIVMDDRTCMVEVARYFLAFLSEESCGKCTPCREGLKQLLTIYNRIVEGKGRAHDIQRIERLAWGMKVASLCELGKSAPNPVLSTIKYFREEYEAHINNKSCPAGVCTALTAYKIIPDTCDGCHACTRVCPVDAIEGEKGELHRIDQEKCISCGSCWEVCPIDAIKFLPKIELNREVQ